MLIKIYKFLFFTIVLMVVIVIGSTIYLTSYLNEPIQTPTTIYIPKGSTKSAMIALKKSGIDIGILDYYVIKMIGYPQAGWIDLKQTIMNRRLFLERITHSKAAVQDITLIPGETKEIFFEQLSKNFDLNISKLKTSYLELTDIPDGLILADTYSVVKGTSEKELIKYLIDKSLKKHISTSKKFLNHYDKKEWFAKYITIASIIQKEAANVEEMPLVSAVIYNRLKRKMKLQMDGTLNYKHFSHVKVTAKRIKDDNSSYNTYKISGLPPYPICAISIDTIRAALKPADVKYLYFVKGKDDKHHFSTTYKAHLRHIPKN